MFLWSDPWVNFCLGKISVAMSKKEYIYLNSFANLGHFENEWQGFFKHSLPRHNKLMLDYHKSLLYRLWSRTEPLKLTNQVYKNSRKV